MPRAPQPASTRPAARVRRASYKMAPLAAVLLVGACAVMDLTDPPDWDLRLNIPSETITIGVGTFLPSGVTIAPDSSSFRLTVPVTTVSQTLGTACSSCVPSNGATVPKPAFNVAQTSTSTLPADVTTATLASGTIALSIVNGFGFDPLAVAGAATSGTLVIVVTDANNRQLAKDSLNGATTSMAAGSTLNRTLTLSPGPIRGPISIASTLVSPVGGPVLINTAQTFSVTGTPTNIAVSNASVTVTNKNVSSSTELDLRELDSEVRERLQNAKLLLTVANPFGVTGNLTVRLQADQAILFKSFALANGTSTPSLEFTKEEARALTSRLVFLTISGPVSSATPVTAGPRDKVNVVTRLEVTMSTEEK